MNSTNYWYNFKFVADLTNALWSKKGNKMKCAQSTIQVNLRLDRENFYVKFRLHYYVYMSIIRSHVLCKHYKMAIFWKKFKIFFENFSEVVKKCRLRKIYAKDFDYFSDNITLCHFFNVVSTHIHRHYGNAFSYEVIEEMFYKTIRNGLSPWWAADTWSMVWICCELITVGYRYYD